jgi:hypothetical protein
MPAQLCCKACHSLQHLLELDCTGGIDIVEIGGGYAGLCVAMSVFQQRFGLRINSYTIIDLQAPSQLQVWRLSSALTAEQQMYLSKFDLRFPVRFGLADLFGRDIEGDHRFIFGYAPCDGCRYLISHYAFSEICSRYQQQYAQHLFPKVDHGFLTWNAAEVQNLPYAHTACPERPLTYLGNLFIKF